MGKLAKTAAVLIVPFFWLIMLVAFGKMMEKSFLAAVLFIPLTVGLFYFYICSFSRKNSFQSIRNTVLKNRKRTWICMQTFSIIVTAVFLIKMSVVPSWDWGTVLENACNYVLKGPDSVDMVYFSRYPNNKAWLMILVYYFKLLKCIVPGLDADGLGIASAILSAVFCQITVLLTYETARLILKSEWRSLGVGLVLVVSLPIYMYSQEAYTDTIAMMLVCLAGYLFYRMKDEENKRKKIALLIGISLVAALIFKIKILAFIIIIGIWISSFLELKKIKVFLVYNIIGLLVFAGGAKVIDLASDSIISVSDENRIKYEFPMVHWVMMGMNDYGGYLEDDVVYTKKAGDYSEKQAADIDRLKERINKLGAIGVINHLLNTKLSRTWGNSFLSADDYASRNPILYNGFMQKLFGKNGRYHWIALLYEWLIYMMIIVGMLIEALLAYKNELIDKQARALRYSIYGVGLFLTLWECNSRYLLPFYPMMIILGISGWSALKDALIKRRENDS